MKKIDNNCCRSMSFPKDFYRLVDRVLSIIFLSSAPLLANISSARRLERDKFFDYLLSPPTNQEHYMQYNFAFNIVFPLVSRKAQGYDFLTECAVLCSMYGISNYILRYKI